jgi:hypothetical protein
MDELKAAAVTGDDACSLIARAMQDLSEHMQHEGRS